MNLTVLNYMQRERVKPFYYLKDDDKFSLICRIDPEEDKIVHAAHAAYVGVAKKAGSADRDCGLYFIDVVSKTKPQWSYKVESLVENYGTICLKHEQTQIHDKAIESSVINNRLFYTKVRINDMKRFCVLYER